MSQKLRADELDNVTGGACDDTPENTNVTVTITYRKEADVKSQWFEETVTFTLPSNYKISDIQNKCREWCQARNYYYGHFMSA